MVRVYKRYEFYYNNPLAAAKQVAFSSYPGALNSFDDYYQMDTDLVMMETTNNVMNNALWKYVSPSTLLS